MHYYQHHIGDFIKDTSFLTNEEVGIYMKLLWIYYDTEEPLPNDIQTLAMKLDCRERIYVVQNILDLFFNFKNNEWHHIRCDGEIAHYHKQLEVASKAGKASAAKRKGNPISTPVERPLNARTTSVQLTNNHKPITNNQLKTKDLMPDGMNISVWSDFLILRKAKKLPITQTALNGIEKEAQKAGKSLADAIQICCERGWAGFKAEWLKTAPEKQDKMKNFWLQIEGKNNA